MILRVNYFSVLRQPCGQGAEGGVGFAQCGVVRGEGGGLGLHHGGVAAGGGTGEGGLGAEGLQVGGGALYEAVGQRGYVCGGHAGVLPQLAGGGVQHGQEVAGEHGGGVVEGLGFGGEGKALRADGVVGALGFGAGGGVAFQCAQCAGELARRLSHLRKAEGGVCAGGVPALFRQRSQ